MIPMLPYDFNNKMFYLHVQAISFQSVCAGSSQELQVINSFMLVVTTTEVKHFVHISEQFT